MLLFLFKIGYLFIRVENPILCGESVLMFSRRECLLKVSVLKMLYIIVYREPRKGMQNIAKLKQDPSRAREKS